MADQETRPFEQELDFTNPYKRSQLFIKDGRAFYGLWQAIEVQLDGDEEELTIPMGMEGHLDTVAQITLGDREYWRAIAHVNKIDFPREEVKAGDVIIIPKLSNVRAAYEEASGRASDL